MRLASCEPCGNELKQREATSTDRSEAVALVSNNTQIRVDSVCDARGATESWSDGRVVPMPQEKTVWQGVVEIVGMEVGVNRVAIWDCVARRRRRCLIWARSMWTAGWQAGRGAGAGVRDC